MHTNTEPDWADEIAREIHADFRNTMREDWATVIETTLAHRLRLIAHEHQRKGIEQCREALLTEEIVHDAHKPVLAPSRMLLAEQV